MRREARNPPAGKDGPAAPPAGHAAAPDVRCGAHNRKGVMLQQHNPLKYVVGRARFERATLCLKGRYSTY